MNTPLQQAAKEILGIWDAPEWQNTRIITEVIAELRKAVDAELAQSVEPYAVFHGLVDSGEHGAFNLDLLKMIPRGAYLYLHPPQPQVTTPAVSNDWLIRKEPNTKDKYYVAEGKPPANVLEIYEITGEKP